MSCLFPIAMTDGLIDNYVNYVNDEWVLLPNSMLSPFQKRVYYPGQIVPVWRDHQAHVGLVNTNFSILAHLWQEKQK